MDKKNKKRKTINKAKLLLTLLVLITIISGLAFGGFKIYTMLRLKEVPKTPSKVVAPQSAKPEIKEEENKEVIFTHSEIPYEVRLRMVGKSMPKEDSLIKFSDLSYLKLTYYGFDNKIHNGEMVVSKEVAPEAVSIFKELYEKKYPIEKVKLIDEYDGDDEASMEDNNTSAFCYRVISGTDTLSNHAKGLAIDINPKQNPHVTETAVLPQGSESFANRDDIKRGMIKKYDLCYKAFTKRGWGWGGHWKNPDYQHFEK